MQPTVNVTIDKVWDAKQEEPEKKCDPESEHKCDDTLQAVVLSFGIGVLVGGVLLYAFSKSAVHEV